MPMTSPSWDQKTDSDVATEFSSIQDWAKFNSMIINIVKTKEIIFYNPRATPISVSPPILGIKRVPSAKLLSVYIQDNLSCDIHFKHIIAIASQRLHILEVLKRQGLSLDLLHGVFYALIVNKITYAISAWFGFLHQSHVLQINSLLKRAFKFGYVQSIVTIEQLLENFDDTLLNKAIASNHTMHDVPTPKSICYSLRSVGLGLLVEFARSELHKKTFINLVVFKDCY